MVSFEILMGLINITHIFLNFRNMTIDFCFNRLSMHLFLYKSDS